MNVYLFRLIEGSSAEEAEEELAQAGLEAIFVIEEDASGEILLGGHSKKKLRVKKMVHSLLAEEKQEADVDWEEQWSLFAKDFKEGKAHIDLSPFGSEKTLLLNPGPGFGDLSHPTTYLMLEMMAGRVQGKTVVDIGTGSGILALAALLLGAKSAIGIDIDPKAVSHAKENGKLNGLSNQVKFSKRIPKKLPNQTIFLMNMIVPEQELFEPQRFNSLTQYWIVSGILESQKEAYLARAAEWGWKTVEEQKRGEWFGFIFSLNKY